MRERERERETTRRSCEPTTELTSLGISTFARFVIVPADKDLPSSRAHPTYTYIFSPL